jgi:hypothetical protein
LKLCAEQRVPLNHRLVAFGKSHSLPGIKSDAKRGALVGQLIESMRRVRYVSIIRDRDISDERGDASSELFDPLKAAILRHREGQADEAFWLIFIFVHFGKNYRTGWRLARDVYSALGQGITWTWQRVSEDPKAFRRWLARNQKELRSKATPRHFGNHRKYESLDAVSSTGTGAAVETYIKWVAPPRTHLQLVHEAEVECDGDPRRMFDFLYRSMSSVARFGRTARFDYLAMVGKIGLAAIEPGATYMNSATGPLKGARLLFGGRRDAALSAPTLEHKLAELEKALHVGPFGMQVLEDALCNWQKSPGVFIPFRG